MVSVAKRNPEHCVTCSLAQCRHHMQLGLPRPSRPVYADRTPTDPCPAPRPSRPVEARPDGPTDPGGLQQEAAQSQTPCGGEEAVRDAVGAQQHQGAGAHVHLPVTRWARRCGAAAALVQMRTPHPWWYSGGLQICMLFLFCVEGWCELG